MNIRQFHPGDEAEQLRIYNTAAAGQIKFKPAAIVDLQRRTQAKDFDPANPRIRRRERRRRRLLHLASQRPCRLSVVPAGLRIGSGPSIRPHAAGDEAARHPPGLHCIPQGLADHHRFFSNKTVSSWPARVINYLLPFENMPTPSARVSNTITAATVEDAAGIFALDPSVFRVGSADALRDALWNNPYFTPASLFVMRQRGDGSPLAAGIFITKADYADPRAVDTSMPCFRLGAFGTEGMTTKRIKGLFSFVTKPDRSVFSVGMDLLSYASNMLTDDDEIGCYAAQAASDAMALNAFYKQTFERQGSFWVFEKDLA